MNPLRPGAVYRQLAEELRERIADGEWAPGQRLPSEKDLVAETGRGRETVRKALRILHDDGLIVVRHGYPSRVADRGPMETVRVMRGSELTGRRATEEERAAMGSTVIVLVDPAGRERLCMRRTGLGSRSTRDRRS